MVHNLVVQQTKIETEALGHVTRVFEVATAWVVEADVLSRTPGVADQSHEARHDLPKFAKCNSTDSGARP
jgi:hypothetical protein